jgi:hypothetical protein
MKPNSKGKKIKTKSIKKRIQNKINSNQNNKDQM